MGFTFKENCPDLRNTRVVDLISELQNVNCNVDVYDPWIDKVETKREYDIIPINVPTIGKYDAIILAVAHNEFREMGAKSLRKFGKANHVLYDIKYILSAKEVDGRL
jgi:UDP-N-acetyl-D-galactosamine dehydrogenase